eukprot:jgi/Mesvir1/24768/Mv22023-RA.1
MPSAVACSGALQAALLVKSSVQSGALSGNGSQSLRKRLSGPAPACWSQRLTRVRAMADEPSSKPPSEPAAKSPFSDGAKSPFSDGAIKRPPKAVNPFEKDVDIVGGVILTPGKRLPSDFGDSGGGKMNKGKPMMSPFADDPKLEMPAETSIFQNIFNMLKSATLDQFAIVLSFVMIVCLMLVTVFIVVKAGGVHFNDS